MPIQKNVPSALNKSDDDRIVKQNEMTDAKNITVSTDSSGNAFVVKNVRGTTAVLKKTIGDAVNTNYSVLGSCVDEEEQMLYFAAYDNSSTNHCIFRLSLSDSTPQYQKVFSHALLFESSTKPEYVDMDVLRADVNQSGTIVPILYFTDGVNNPKKINVSRAMDGSDAGGYTSTDDISEFIDVAKTKPVHQFFVECGTNINFDGNFIYGRNLSFCLQYVYKDGEHSALSNLSEMCVPQVIMNDEEDGRKPIAGNFFFFDVPIGSQEVREINVVFRDNETGVYYIADRILKGADITRNGVQIWDNDGGSGTDGRYFFYGDSDYEVVPMIEANKLYDNVPFTAKTQTMIDGRLMYGNYTEGRAVPDVKANITAKLNGRYSNTINEFSFVAQDNASNFGGAFAATDIKIDTSNLQATFFSGDEIYLDFTVDYDELFAIRSGGAHAITNTNSGNVHETGKNTSFSARFKDVSFRFRLTQGTTSEINIGTFRTNLKASIDAHTVTVNYANVNNVTSAFEQTSGGSTPLNQKITQADIEFSFLATISGTDIIISPKIKNLTNVVTDFSAGTIGVVSDMTDFLTGEHGSSTLPTVIDVGSAFLVKDFHSYRTFKTGANHTLGMIFYDKKGRCSTVKEIGSVYIPTLGERKASERGLARIEVQFPQVGGNNQTLPSWVDKFQFVYGGSDVDEFKQYSVSGGFSSYWRHGSFLSTSDSEDASDNIYVSLKGWSGSVQSYTGTNGADYIYNYKEGDVLRVVSYDVEDGTGTKTVYPNKLEFSVVGKKRLREDVTGQAMENIRADIEAEAQSRGPVADAVRFAVGGLNQQLERFFVLPGTARRERKEEEIEELQRLQQEAIAEATDKFKNIPLSKRNDVFPGDWAPAKGDFLVLKHNGSSGWGPDDSAHVELNNSGNPVSAASQGHDGADANEHWHPIGNWMRNVVVEIYTPKNKTRTKTYKELTRIISKGQSGTPFLSNYQLNQDLIQLRSGDTWFKKTPLSTISKNSNGYSLASSGHHFNYWKLDEFSYVMTWLESDSASHFFPSKRHNFGRTHIVNKYAATNTRSYSITYSDKYNSDSPILNLSNFNLSKSNFMDLPSSYSQVDRLIADGANMTAIQGARACRIPIGKAALKLATQQDILTSADKVLGDPVYYAGDYGSRGLSQAVVKHNQNIFFVDYVARKVLQLSPNGLSDISGIGMDSYFDTNLETWSRLTTRTRLYLGYDPDYDELIVFAQGDSSQSFSGFVAAYKTPLKKWTSTYTMIDNAGNEPTLFEKLGDKLVSCNYSPSGNANGAQDTLFHIHQDSATRSEMYGKKQESVVEVVSNFNPSMVKVFESVSLEGNTSNFTAAITTSDQNTDISSWTEKERGYYAVMPRDKSANSTSHKMFVGTNKVDTTIGGTTLTFNEKINRIPKSMLVGAKLYNETQNEIITSDGTPSGTQLTIKEVLSSSQIQFTDGQSFSANTVVAVNDSISVILDQATFGDAIRDYFCKIRLTNTNSSGAAFELYSINTHFDRSKLGSEKG